MFLNLWRRVMKQHSQTSQRGRNVGRQRKHGFKPGLELLESRMLLSTVRTLAYNEITALSADMTYNYGLYPVLSADGSRAVFRTTTYIPDRVNHVLVINTDGTGQPTQVDSYPDYNVGPFDISADGTKVISVQGPTADTYHIRMVNADGTGEHEVIAIAYGYIQDRLSSDGSKVFFTDDRDFEVRVPVTSLTRTGTTATVVTASPHEFVTGDQISVSGADQVEYNGRFTITVVNPTTFTYTVFGDPATPATGTIVAAKNLTKGLYVVNADGSGLIQIVSGAQIGTLLGVPTDNIYVTTGGPSLAMTTGYSQIVFGVGSVGVGYYVLGVTFDGSQGSGLDPILFAQSVWHAGISGDGSKVFYDISVPSAPNDAGVINFDGSGRTVLARSDSFGYPASDDPMQISADGSQLLMGTSSVLIDTTTGAKLQLAARGGWFSSDPAPLLYDGMFRATMNSTATRFLYIAGDNNGVRQLATLDIDPDNLGAAPSLDNLSIDPSAIVAGGAPAMVSATVSTTNTLIRVSNAVLREGLDDGLVNHAVMLDDGTGVFSSNQISAYSNAVPGPRTVRVKAEVRDSAGFRHATAVEFDPFEVVAPPSPPSGGRPGLSTVGAALLGFAQTGQAGATNRPVGTTASQLQPFALAQPGQEEWALLLAGFVPDSRKAPSEDADAVWTALSHDDWTRMTDPLGSPAFDLAPVVSLDFGK
jgi:hypothetical protein